MRAGTVPCHTAHDGERFPRVSKAGMAKAKKQQRERGR
jgi:hypothetical protein